MKKLVREYEYSQAQLNTMAKLAEECGISDVVAKILYSRGVDTPEKIKRFLSPSKKHFISPFKMSGMSDLKNTVDEMVRSGGHILVFGDYDADGICASSILFLALREYGADVSAYVPERADGYGMKKQTLERLIDERNPSLVISVDCGISNRSEVEYVRSRDIKVIVTDHHELPELLPDCIIVNPKLKDDYPYDNLCGAGVAFKVACALLGETAYKFLDLAAVATVADSVPLTDENRDIVSEGLKILNKSPREALGYLFNLSAYKSENVTSQTIAFVIAPRINAAGRMGDAASALKLFTSESSSEIYDLATKLCAYNDERRVMCENLSSDIRSKLKECETSDKIIMLYDETWLSGIIGIVAAQIVEDFNRPTILFVKNGDMLKGSARTIEGINIYEALKACDSYITEFGGHAQAAGVNVTVEQFSKLKNALSKYLGEKYDESAYVSTISVAERLDSPVSLSFVKELERLEPFGVGNKKPLFYYDAGVCDVRRLKEGTPHISIKNLGADVIWFSGEHALPYLQSDLKKQLVVDLSVSKFRDEEYVRANVKEMLYDTSSEEYEIFSFKNKLQSLKKHIAQESDYAELKKLDCRREYLAEIYTAIRGIEKNVNSSEQAANVLSDKYSKKQTVFAVEVFIELGFLRFDNGLNVIKGKRGELTDSVIYSSVLKLKGE